jgi:hypothetical protein
MREVKCDSQIASRVQLTWLQLFLEEGQAAFHVPHQLRPRSEEKAHGLGTQTHARTHTLWKDSA